MKQGKESNLWVAVKMATFALLLTITLAGCSSENTMEDPQDDYGEKEKAQLKINLVLEGTKAETYNDQLIENVNIFITDEMGNITYKGYHKSVLEIQTEIYPQMKYTIYAIANAGRELEARDAEEVENLEITIPDISYLKSSSGAMLMSGKTDPQKLDTKGETTIYLTRCVSKITVKADFAQLKEDVEIEIQSIKLLNAPNSIKLYKPNKILSPQGSINGKAEYNITTLQLQKGITFYQFENLQGTLQPQNTQQQQKQWPEGSLQSKTCSYIELSATYTSPRKYGEILYRFYLGEDMLGNYDIKRNTQLNIIVNFINEGAVDENTWRVDNGEIIDLVTEIQLSPTSLVFTEQGTTLPITAQVYPSTAQNKTLEWYTSDATVAEADNLGNVTARGRGECQIYAKSTDGTEIVATCSVFVNIQDPNDPDTPENPDNPDTPENPDNPQNPDTPDNPQNPDTPENPDNPYLPQFEQKEIKMYDGQKCLVKFAAELPEGTEIIAESNNEQIIKIISTSTTGITVEAPIWQSSAENPADSPSSSTAQATITARIGDKTTQCLVIVEKVRIKAAQTQMEIYNHFYQDIEYTILPQFAAKELTEQGITLKTSSINKEITTAYEGIEERIIPQIGAETQLPLQTNIKLSLIGRPDVETLIPTTIKPMIKIAEEIIVNANLGNSNVEKSLALDSHPRAQIKFSWTPADGIQYYGNPGEGDYEISVAQNIIIFPVPNSANGLYRLNATVTGDDNYGQNATETDATAHCNISIYETIYLTGISKTIERNRVEGEQHTWEYTNEIVAKWLSHPNSLLYPQGELNLNLPFSYNGETYTENHTGKTETFTFTFEKGEELRMALETESITYNGTPPQYYLEYFKLQPVESPYITGNPATEEPYLYIYSRPFVSGFSKTPTPNWEKIFEIIYPKRR